MDLGLNTGGMVPNGWKTKFGSRPQLQKLGLIEHPTSDKYPPRTAWNVKNSCATIRFAFNFDSSGEICTYQAIKKYNKPYFDVDLNDLISGDNLYFIDVPEFFHKHNVEILNVAGNCGATQSEAKKIYNLVYHHLKKYIELYHEHYKVKDEIDIGEL